MIPRTIFSFFVFCTLDSSSREFSHVTAINLVAVPPIFQISNLFIMKKDDRLYQIIFWGPVPMHQ